MIYEYDCNEASGSLRLDVFVSNKMNITRAAAQKLIENGFVYVCGRNAAKNHKLRTGETVEVNVPKPKRLDAVAQNIPINILYEDKDLVIVNKPQGMVVHPAAGNYDGTLVNALMYHCGGELSAINGIIRPGIVHRLDKETSGILVVAKSNESHLILADMIKKHNFDREYVCLINGNCDDKFTVDRPIGRHPKDRKKMTVTEKNSRHAVTHFEVLERFPSYTLLRCILETGRTHQIRVHLKSINKGIVGDSVYGLKKDVLRDKYHLSGQMLHACRLGFCHPRTGEYMEFKCPVPPYFADILNDLRGKLDYK